MSRVFRLTLTLAALGLLASFQNCEGHLRSATSAPTEAVTAASVDGTPAWVGQDWSSCTNVCGGGQQMRTVDCRTTNGPVIETSCSVPKPATQQSCNTQACATFMWIEGGFGACDQSCGGGSQSQSVTCVDASGAVVSDANCAGPKPLGARACNTQACVVTQPTAEACASSPHGNILFEHPVVDNIDACLVINPKSPTPPGRMFVGMNVPLPTPDGRPVAIPFDMDQFTGVNPGTNATERARWQRGVDANWYGSSAVQAKDQTVGLQIHPESLYAKGTTPPVGLLFPFVVSYNWAQPPRPFAAPGKTLVFSLEIEIPSAESNNVTSFAYADAYLIFSDPNGKKFWFGGRIFDNRADLRPDRVANDDWANGTGLPIVSATLGNPQSDFLRARPGSAPFQLNPWRGYKTFEIALNAGNLAAVIRQLNATCANGCGYSTDVTQYRVEHWNYNPEVAYFGSFGSIGTSVRNVRVFVEDATPGQ